jgi:two-component system, cell cycle sensor histidine kinase and response regulator CckA
MNGYLMMSERVLQHTEARFHSLMEALADGVLLAEPGGCIRAVNGAFHRLLETGGRALGCDLRQFAPLRRLGLGPELLALLGAGVEFERQVEVGLGGEPRACRVQGRTVRSPGGELLEVYLLVRDESAVTRLGEERSKLQLQLQRSQRMESFGLLAAGIAHDLNNVLSCIMGAADMLLAEQLDPVSRLRLAQQVVEASERGAEMTRKVLSLARQEDGRRQPVNAGQVARDVFVLLRRSIDPRIEIELEVESGPLGVLADTASLHQILMNLGVNARDAMPAGGRLQVRCQRLGAREALADAPAFSGASLRTELAERWRESPAGWVVRVEVLDNGTGMPPERLPWIFDAFYTTKAVEQGTGLGLSMVRQTVLELEGWLDVSSSLGQGTSFRVHLPLLDEGLRPQSAGAAEALTQGKGRVLLVDDDEVVRQTTGEMLQALGYEVRTAGDGIAALERYSDDPNGWDLVLLDLMMPRMDGLETLRRIVQLRPEQRVLIATGYANQSILADLQRVAEVPVLMKPFRFAELSARIAGLLA